MYPGAILFPYNINSWNLYGNLTRPRLNYPATFGLIGLKIKKYFFGLGEISWNLERTNPAKLQLAVSQHVDTTAYHVGDQVRVSVAKGHFDKGCLPNCTEQIYTVNRPLDTAPPQYKIQDYYNEVIMGSFSNHCFNPNPTCKPSSSSLRFACCEALLQFFYLNKVSTIHHV